MLKSVRIENFRCFKEVEVPLKPLTVLIGANDTGKTAFLHALLRMGQVANFVETDFWQKDVNNCISVNGIKVAYWVGLPQSKPGNVAHYRYANSFSFINKQILMRHTGFDYSNPVCPANYFQLPPTGVSMVSPGYRDEGDPPSLESTGQNVAGMIDYLLRRDEERFASIRSSLSSLVPGVTSLKIATPDPSSRRVDFVFGKNLTLPAESTSTGVRLLLFFLTLAYHPQPPRLVLVEEPENGVHPRRLAEIMRLLRELTQGKHGDHAAQVVLTTHSPYLLDYVDLNTDQVLVFRRNDDGSRTAEPVIPERLKEFLEGFKLGEVWYNLGESELVRQPS